MIYLYSVLNLVVIIIAKAFYDKSQIDKGKGIAHSKEWLIMAIASIPAIYLLGNEIGKWYDYVIAAIDCMVFIWVFFDMLLNKLRGKSLSYAGVITANSSWWDKQLNNIAPKWRLIIKVLLLILVISVYVLTLFNGK